MSFYGYQPAGNSKSASPDFIPSLICVDELQLNPSSRDLYLTRIDLPAGALNISRLALSRWVSYDSLPAQTRDPLIAIQTHTALSFYCPCSELIEQLEEFGDDHDRDFLSTLRGWS